MPILVPQIVPVVPRVYRLRWGFEFAGDRAPRRGPWDVGSDRPEDGAWAVDKTGLTRAFVEGENRETYEVVRLAEVPGQDYVSAAWDMHARAGTGLGIEGAFTPFALVHGLALITRDERVTVTVDGRVARRALSTDELRFDLFEHRAGT